MRPNTCIRGPPPLRRPLSPSPSLSPSPLTARPCLSSPPLAVSALGLPPRPPLPPLPFSFYVYDSPQRLHLRGILYLPPPLRRPLSPSPSLSLLTARPCLSSLPLALSALGPPPRPPLPPPPFSFCVCGSPRRSHLRGVSVLAPFAELLIRLTECAPSITPFSLPREVRGFFPVPAVLFGTFQASPGLFVQCSPSRGASATCKPAFGPSTSGGVRVDDCGLFPASISRLQNALVGGDHRFRHCGSILRSFYFHFS